MRVNRPYSLCFHVTAELLIPVGHALDGERIEAPQLGTTGTRACSRASRKYLLCALRFRIRTYKTAFQCHRGLLWGNVSCVLRFDKFQRRASECIQTTYVDQGITMSSMSSGRQGTCCRWLSLFSMQAKSRDVKEVRGSRRMMRTEHTLNLIVYRRRIEDAFFVSFRERRAFSLRYARFRIFENTRIKMERLLYLVAIRNFRDGEQLWKVTKLKIVKWFRKKGHFEPFWDKLNLLRIVLPEFRIIIYYDLNLLYRVSAAKCKLTSKALISKLNRV